VLAREEGEIVEGTISIDGISVTRLAADAIVRQGVAQVPEGRALFADLTVEENLVMGGYTRPRAESAVALEEIYSLFPRVRERRRQVAGYLSGGEQQMVALGRALMSRPRLLMMDEPSLGLAPQIVDAIFETVQRLNRESGLAVLLVEQNAHLALSIASYGYIMENGRVVLDGTPDRLAANADVQEFYLGGAGAGGARRSMRDVKHYKRRKRWLS
jgi:branched-chain amino acid transport system ATP-binding protein